jgi:hypothetical protein
MGAMIMTRTRSTGLVAAFLLLCAGAVSAPTASSAAAATKVVQDPNSACISQALASGSESWTCFGDELTTSTTDAAGKDIVRREKVADPTVPAFVDESRPTPTVGTEARSAEELTVASDDYDTWCESGTICGRQISAYIAEVKGNGAYGDQNGVIGRVDVIQRQSFNGPYPRWRGLLIWDSGPAVTTTRYTVTCRINVDGPDGTCGGITHYFSTISSGNWRSWSPSSTGYRQNSQRLVGSTYYHEDAYGSFTASGRSQVFYYGTLHTGRWRYCSSNCQYYQVPWKA